MGYHSFSALVFWLAAAPDLGAVPQASKVADGPTIPILYSVGEIQTIVAITGWEKFLSLIFVLF